MRTPPLLVSLLFGVAMVGCGPDGIDEPGAAFEQAATADAGAGAGIEIVAAPVDEHAADDAHDDDAAHDAAADGMTDEAAHDDAMPDDEMTDDVAHDDAVPDAMPDDEMAHDDAMADDATHDDARHDDAMADEAAHDEAADGAMPAAATALVIDVEMVEFGYVMNTAAVPMGEPVTFRFTNTGNIEHEAMFGSAHQQEEFASAGGHGDAHGGGHHGDVAAITLAAGETGELVLNFEEGGEMWIGCHIAGHWDAGMFTPFSVDA